jgi:hypothetical protein
MKLELMLSVTLSFYYGWGACFLGCIVEGYLGDVDILLIV